MEESVEGSLILEKLAEVGLEDEFFEAIDSDDFVKVVSLLREAGIDEASIHNVIEELGAS